MNPLALLDQLQPLLLQVGGVGAILAALFGWLGKRQLERAIVQLKSENDMQLERTKGQLQQELEVIKSRLSLESSMLQAKINCLSERRLEAIAHSASLLAQAWLQCRAAIQPDELSRDRPPPQSRFESAADALDAFFADFESTRIMLPRAVADAAYDFIYRTQKALEQFRIHSLSTDTYQESLNRLYAAWLNELSPSVNRARELLESEYRKIIGVESAV